MNQLSPERNNDTLQMSSREIAEVVQSRHDSVKRAIERLAERGVIDSPPLVEYRDSLNRAAQEFKIRKRDSFVVVAQLSPEFTARLVDRWQELEGESKEPEWIGNLSPQAKVAIEDLNSRAQFYQKETNRLQGVCHDLARNLRDGMTPVAFCRMLNGVNTQKVQPMLLHSGYLLKAKYGYRTASRWRDKLFTERKVRNQDDQLCESVVLTKRGAKWLYSLYEKRQLAMKSDWDGRYSHVLFDEEESAA